MKIYALAELIAQAKEKSPYYGQLYKNISDPNKATLADLPVIDQGEFWAANTMRDNQLLTGPMEDGIVFKSGGTTGQPKFSIFTRDEWETFTSVFGEGMGHTGLVKGDRVANLFYAGELYASFNFIMKSLEACPVPTVQFGISGAASPEVILKTVDDFQINVISGLPTTILAISEQYALEPSKYSRIKVEKILFGGESMYADQRKRLQVIYPGVKISSIGYASVDAGLLGYADSSCDADEHRVFSKSTIFEIVDENTLEPIEEPDRPGKVLITNLTRVLMPIIRYPVGDIAIWRQPASKADVDRKFLILGRSEEAARVGPVSLYYEDMRAFLDKANIGFRINAFQLVTRHYDTRDALVLKIATSETALDRGKIEEQIVALFSNERPMFAQAAAQNIIHPLVIEWAGPSDIEINARTGKLRRVIDQRR
jgi:phenylacetate-CoA ligase